MISRIVKPLLVLVRLLEVLFETPQRTIEESWRFTSAQYCESIRDPHIQINPERFRLLPDIPHERGLQWIMLNLAGNRIRGAHQYNPLRAAHAAVVWAAGYFRGGFERWMVSTSHTYGYLSKESGQRLMDDLAEHQVCGGEPQPQILYIVKPVLFRAVEIFVVT